MPGSASEMAGRYGTTCAAKVLGWSRLDAAEAIAREARRRSYVLDDLRNAEAETNPRDVVWWVNRTERMWGIHRPDERARVAVLRRKVRELAEARQASLRNR